MDLVADPVQFVEYSMTHAVHSLGMLSVWVRAYQKDLTEGGLIVAETHALCVLYMEHVQGRSFVVSEGVESGSRAIGAEIVVKRQILAKRKDSTSARC